MEGIWETLDEDAQRDHYGRVLRNLSFNVVSAIMPAVVAIFAIRVAVTGLGRERFGVLALTWAVLSYFSFFDLGVGRAITQRLPALIEAGDHDGVRRVIGTAIALLTVLGVLAGVVLGCLAPWLVNHAATIPAGLRSEALQAFRILASTVPFLIIAAGFRSALEGAERFGFSNLVRVPQTILFFTYPALAPRLGWDLGAIAWASFATVVLSGLAYLALMAAVVPGARGVRFDPKVLPRLISYGGWLTVVQLVWSFMLQLDRLAIGFLLGADFVAYYAAPYELISRAWILSSALVALLPAVARLHASRKQEIAGLAAWSLRQVLLVAGLPLLFVAAFSRTLLEMWLGSDFASHSAMAFSILAVASLISVVAGVPDIVVKGLGQPRRVAYIHLGLIGPYGLALYLLIPALGIRGAALAWLARALVESALLYRASAMVLPRMRSVVRDPALLRLVAFLAVYALLLGGLALALPAMVAIAAGAGLVAVAVFAAWRWLLSASERLQFKRLATFA